MDLGFHTNLKPEFFVNFFKISTWNSNFKQALLRWLDIFREVEDPDQVHNELDSIQLNKTWVCREMSDNETRIQITSKLNKPQPRNIIANNLSCTSFAVGDIISAKMRLKSRIDGR